MNYTSLPELIAILWMAVVLARLRRGENDDLVRLWIAGLFLFVVEGVARMLYLMPLSPGAHATMHVIALDSYLLAGVAFFQSATGRLRLMPYSESYLFLCAMPHLGLLTLYGAGVQLQPLFVFFSVAGAVISIGASGYLRRNKSFWACHLAIWLPILFAAQRGHFRLVAYLSLFFIYMATAIAFLFTLSKERKGRAVVVAGFAIWSLCFLTHPWIAEHRAAWVSMAETVWNLQKFMVMFGLLIVSLEEQSASNEYQALHDTLTGLPNRRLFEDRFEQALARANRNHTRMVLYVMDLDDFKRVNDTLGHVAGDELLREIGHRLAAVTRDTDTLARMGGDEFYLLINDFNVQDETFFAGNRLKEQTQRLSDTFRRAVEGNPYLLKVGEATHRLEVRLSLGCVVFPDEGMDQTELLRVADQRMYGDKKKRSSNGLELVAANS